MLLSEETNAVYLYLIGDVLELIPVSIQNRAIVKKAQLYGYIFGHIIRVFVCLNIL